MAKIIISDTSSGIITILVVWMMQADWSGLRRDYPWLNPAQLDRVLSDYQLGSGQRRPPAWEPPVHEKLHAQNQGKLVYWLIIIKIIKTYPNIKNEKANGLALLLLKI